MPNTNDWVVPSVIASADLEYAAHVNWTFIALGIRDDDTGHIEGGYGAGATARFDAAALRALAITLGVVMQGDGDIRLADFEGLHVEAHYDSPIGRLIGLSAKDGPVVLTGRRGDASPIREAIPSDDVLTEPHSGRISHR